MTPTYIVPRERIVIPVTGALYVKPRIRSAFIYALLFALILFVGQPSTESVSNTAEAKLLTPTAAALPKPIQASAKVAFVSSKLKATYGLDSTVSERLASLFVKYGTAEDHDPLLLAAISYHESRFNQEARSHVGAIGIMQIMPRYHMEKIAECGDFRSSIEANVCTGAKVLRQTKDLSATLMNALLRYNGSLGDPDAVYANDVLRQYRRLKSIA